ncbi:hypothetical protein DV738_g3213, partial [Chaetothyriales sp. CBS 135597]
MAQFIAPVATITTRVWGTKATLLIGITLQTAALLGASWASQIWQLFLSQALCFGFGMGMQFSATVGIIPQWFTRRRSLANGIATAGSGIGGLIYSLVTSALIQRLGIGWAFRILAIVSAAACGFAALIVRDRNKAIGAIQIAFHTELLKRPEFLLTLAWGAFSVLGYVALLFSIPGYGSSVGLTPSQGSILGAMFNLGGGLGRPVIGHVSDIFGRLNTALVCTFLAGLFSLVIWIFAKSFGVLIFFALICGPVAATFTTTVAPVAAEVVGLQLLPSALSIFWLSSVTPSTFAEPIALWLRTDKSTNFLHAQIFVGFMFMGACICLLLVRAWKISDVEMARDGRDPINPGAKTEDHNHAVARAEVEKNRNREDAAMDYLIRFSTQHESFRLAEIEALTQLVNNTQNNAVVASFISHSIQAKAIYEVWGRCGDGDYESLHGDVRARSQHLWPRYQDHGVSFKFSIDSYFGKRSTTEQRDIINQFAYFGFQGKVDMKNPQQEWCILEEWDKQPRRIILGRKIASSRRHLVEKHDLKKRPYISTTSMDAELALITATLALASPGKLFLDPFCGTGGFMVAAAELGAVVLGSDIDGRSFRGKGGQGVERGVGRNMKLYGIDALFGDCLTSDLTNTPFRSIGRVRWLDGIISDIPYGVREGLKVLGRRQPAKVEGEQDNGSSLVKEPHMIGGVLAHTLPGYIAPKKPYSFSQLLVDILDFAARTLVDGGRLAFWMPTANENEEGEQEATVRPSHSLLKFKHECVQPFNKWSRRLLVYERIAGELDDDTAHERDAAQKPLVNGTSADELNPFRRRYFQSFAKEPNG